MKHFLGAGLLAAALAVPACKGEAPAGETKTAAPATKAKDGPEPEYADIKITADRKDLLYTYVDGDGSFKTADTIAAIPEAARKQVVVVDLSLPPEKRRSAEVVYVADLTAEESGGRYPYTVVSRYKFEKKAGEVVKDTWGSADLTDADAKGKVVMYSTEWCGVCKVAKKYMKSNNIPYIERDIEKSEKAAAELDAKAAQAGVRPQGVPVLDVGGQLLLGFEKNRFQKMWDAYRDSLAAAPPADAAQAPDAKAAAPPAGSP